MTRIPCRRQAPRHRSLALASALVLATAALLAAPAQAATYFESTTRMAAGQGGGEQVLRTRSWVDADNAKVVFVESDNPAFPEGSYLLSNDGGRTLYLVDPEEKTYTIWDLSQAFGALGAVMQGAGPMFKIEVSDPKVEKLADEAGEKILGYDTHHYRFRTTYDMEMRIMGMGQASDVETVVDTWTSSALSDPGFGAWLRRDPPKTGIADLDKLMDAQIGQGIQGVPLRMRTVSTSRDKKGRETVTTTDMEVTTIREEAPPAGAFALPAGFEEVEMTLPAGIGGSR